MDNSSKRTASSAEAVLSFLRFGREQHTVRGNDPRGAREKAEAGVS